MKNVKTKLSLVLTTACLFSLVSCGDGGFINHDYTINGVTLTLDEDGTEAPDSMDCYLQDQFLRLKGVVSGEGVFSSKVKYISSNPEVAQVSRKGYVLFNEVGTTTITCSSYVDSTKFDTLTLNVTLLSNATISEKQDYLVEAEDADFTYASSSSTSGEGMIKENADCSGGKDVENLSVIGNKLLYYFNSDGYSRGDLVLRMASTKRDSANKNMVETKVADAMDIEINDVPLDLVAYSLPGKSGVDWYNFVDLTIKNVEFKKGANVLSIISKVGTSNTNRLRFPNFDCLTYKVKEFSNEELAPITISNIAIEEGIEKTYSINETFKGGNLIVTYSNGETEKVAITSDMLEGFDTSEAGTKTVTVNYKNLSVRFYITIQGAMRFNETKKYTIEAEDSSSVDLSLARKQDNGNSAFEKIETGRADASGGACTCNISMPGNIIQINFIAEEAGTFDFGIRAQSCSNGGLNSAEVSDLLVFDLNGAEMDEVGGTINKACTGTNKWKDMTQWTELTIKENLQMKKGENKITITFTNKVTYNGTVRAPNFDYFTFNVTALNQ